jgi:hypothetical protein
VGKLSHIWPRVRWAALLVVGLAVLASAVAPSLRSDADEAASCTQEAAEAEVDEETGQQALSPPDLEGWPGLVKVARPGNVSGLHALAWHFRTDVFSAPSKGAKVVGYIRRGTRLPVRRKVTGSGCKKGTWYEISNGGYVCTSTARGFTVSTAVKEFPIRQRPPDLSGPWPFTYGKVAPQGAPRLFRIPTAEEEQLIARAAASEEKPPDVVDQTMEGVFIVALDRVEGEGERRWWRTIRGRYIRDRDVELYPRSPMHGELLDKEVRLPLAFVYETEARVYCSEDDAVGPCGVADKHTRFSVKRLVTHRDKQLAASPEGLMVEIDALRIARAIKRPEEISRDEKWIHVDLSEQTLVAYEGDRPVFATLVSSGKEGYTPPLGTFRVHEKHLSVTMNASDPIDGWYEVEEVPWTLYYWEGFALHGAYWHNDFGRPRSHGCTNIAPADARWLFQWTDPELPGGWHGRFVKGTRVHFSS